MPPSLDADLVQLLVALPSGGTTVFTPLGGEERARLQLERQCQETLALGGGAWNQPLPGGRAAMSLEVEGRSQHGPAETYLHARAFDGALFRLRLRIGNAAWMEGDFLLQRFQYDAPQNDAARYAFTALNDGPVTRTPLPLS